MMMFRLSKWVIFGFYVSGANLVGVQADENGHVNLGGGFQLCFLFTPNYLGKKITHFDDSYFFRWFLVKQPTNQETLYVKPIKKDGVGSSSPNIPMTPRVLGSWPRHYNDFKARAARSRFNREVIGLRQAGQGSGRCSVDLRWFVAFNRNQSTFDGTLMKDSSTLIKMASCFNGMIILDLYMENWLFQHFHPLKRLTLEFQFQVSRKTGWNSPKKLHPSIHPSSKTACLCTSIH